MTKEESNGVRRTVRLATGFLSILVVIVGVAVGLVTDRGRAFSAIERNAAQIERLNKQQAAAEERLRTIETAAASIKTQNAAIQENVERILETLEKRRP